MMFYPRRNQKLTRYKERLLDSGCSRTKNCINAHFLGHTYYAYTPRQQNYSLRSYMRGFVEATLEVDLYLIEPSFMATVGQTCRKKLKNM